jgi:hypothetical protein
MSIGRDCAVPRALLLKARACRFTRVCTRALAHTRLRDAAKEIQCRLEYTTLAKVVDRSEIWCARACVG